MKKTIAITMIVLGCCLIVFLLFKNEKTRFFYKSPQRGGIMADTKTNELDNREQFGNSS